jgi:rhodanese-related sulfurtransferase
MTIKQVSVIEAHALQQQGAVYVDVRSVGEFVRGHPKGAVNVPLVEADEDTGDMMPNPDFMHVMKAVFGVDTPILLGCQMGSRSMHAAHLLDAIGFNDVANVRGGFGGAYDPMTGRADQGWAAAGLPVTFDPAPGASYDELVKKADGIK